jgi:PAS domain-containing protein
MKPWHESARKMGLLSSASFPLKLQGRTVALLVLFAGETGYFLEDEIELMNGVARSVSFAFESIERERQRQLAEMALRESEERFRSVFVAAATGIAISTPHGRFLQANAAYCQMLGYTEDELLTRDFASLTHPEDLHLNLKLRDEILAGTRESQAPPVCSRPPCRWRTLPRSAVRLSGVHVRGA